MSQHRTMNVDVDDATLKDIEINQEVTLVVRGSVRSMSASRAIEDFPGELASETGGKKRKRKRRIPGDITLDVKSVKVKGSNDFDKMFEDEDGDDD